MRHRSLPGEFVMMPYVGYPSCLLDTRNRTAPSNLPRIMFFQIGIDDSA